MELLIVRHGDALLASVDPKRPLSEKGREKVEQLARSLKEKKIEAQCILHSTKLRACQTAQIINDVADLNARMEEKAYLSPDDDIEPLTKEIGEQTNSLMIVGHLPFVEHLVAKLVCGAQSQSLVRFKTATAVILEKKEKKRWGIASVIDIE